MEPGSDLDRTWTGPSGLGLRWTGSRSSNSGPDLEVWVHGPQNLPGPDPDQTVDSVFGTATVCLFGGWLRLYNVAYLCVLFHFAFVPFVSL